MEADLKNSLRGRGARSLLRHRASFALVLFALGGAACSDQDMPKPTGADATPRVFTGALTGTDAELSAIVTAHHARIYFCGGASSYTTLTRWVPAGVSAGSVTADETAGAGWTLHASLDGDSLDGALSTGDAGMYSFHARVTDDRTIAGLYEATSPCGKVGLIITQGSTKDEPTGQGACIGSGNVDFHQVNPVLPLVRSKDGTIRVVVDGSSTEVRVSTAAAPAD
jgi:hypothetical protein